MHTLFCLLGAFIHIAHAQTIDLGYSKVSVANTYNDISAWKNIRYAAPPVGELRFAPPAAPLQEKDVNDGSVGYTCPQAAPENGLTGGLPPTTYEESEDCLMLDVYAPANITDTAMLPVMFWIYGGGFTTGVKEDYPGYGLIAASDHKMIYVAANYRLGAFGFQAGPQFGRESGTANAGLLDQRAALQWTVDHIKKFGGNPNLITVAGESAGGSSIMFQLAALGGSTPPFQRAIMQSPAYLPEFQPSLLDEIYGNFTDLAGCTNPSSGTALDCLRTKSTDELIDANKNQINNNPTYGTFVYGPSVDDSFVQAIPTVEVLRGNVNQIPMLLSFTGNESAIFVNPEIKTEAQFNASIEGYLPDMAALSETNTAQFLNDVQRLYPSKSYSSQYARLSQVVADVLVGCNVYTMASSYPSQSWVYEFNIGEGHHGSDVLYTFYNSYEFTGISSAALGVTNDAIAKAMQMAITTFVMAGTPGYDSYGKSGSMKLLSDSGVTTSLDPNNNDRCRFWESASYDPDSIKVGKTTPSGSTSITTSTSTSTSTPTVLSQAKLSSSTRLSPFGLIALLMIL